MRFNQYSLVKTICLWVAISFIFPCLTWAFEPGVYALASHAPGIDYLGKTIELPAKLGNIEKAFQGRNKTIIHIQDLHCNHEVQKNISQIIHLLAKEHGLKLVGEEGAFSAIDTNPIRSFPIPDIREAVSDYFVSQGKLTGAEYYGANGEYPICLEGIETPKLYAESLQAVRSFLNSESQGYVLDLREMLDGLKPNIYSADLQAVDQARAEYREGKLDVLAYATRLKNFAEQFLGNHGGLPLQDYPNLENYLHLGLKTFEPGVDAEPLFREMNALDRSLRRALYATDLQRELDGQYHRLDVIEKVLNISATQEELQEFRSARANFAVKSFVEFIQSKSRDCFAKTARNDPSKSSRGAEGDVAISEFDPEIHALDQYLAKAEEFYRLADLRSQHFVANLLKKMDANHQTLAVVITGGFHTDGMLSELQEQNIGYVSIKPRLTQQDVVNPYFAILQGRKLPLEQLLMKNQTSLAPRCWLETQDFPPVLEVIFKSLGEAMLASLKPKQKQAMEQYIAQYRIVQVEPRTAEDVAVYGIKVPDGAHVFLATTQEGEKLPILVAERGLFTGKARDLAKAGGEYQPFGKLGIAVFRQDQGWSNLHQAADAMQRYWEGVHIAPGREHPLEMFRQAFSHPVVYFTQTHEKEGWEGRVFGLLVMLGALPGLIVVGSVVTAKQLGFNTTSPAIFWAQVMDWVVNELRKVHQGWNRRFAAYQLQEKSSNSESQINAIMHQVGDSLAVNRGALEVIPYAPSADMHQREALMLVKPPAGNNPATLREFLTRIYNFGYEVVGLKIISGKYFHEHPDLIRAQYQEAWKGYAEGIPAAMQPNVSQIYDTDLCRFLYQGEVTTVVPAEKVVEAGVAADEITRIWNLNNRPMDFAAFQAYFHLDEVRKTEAGILLRRGTEERTLPASVLVDGDKIKMLESRLFGINKVGEGRRVLAMTHPGFNSGKPFLLVNGQIVDVVQMFSGAEGTQAIGLIIRERGTTAVGLGELRTKMLGDEAAPGKNPAGTIRGDSSAGTFPLDPIAQEQLSPLKNVGHMATSVIETLQQARDFLELDTTQFNFYRQLASLGYAHDEIAALLTGPMVAYQGKTESLLDVLNKTDPEEAANIVRQTLPPRSIAQAFAAARERYNASVKIVIQGFALKGKIIAILKAIRDLIIQKINREFGGIPIWIVLGKEHWEKYLVSKYFEEYSELEGAFTHDPKARAGEIADMLEICDGINELRHWIGGDFEGHLLARQRELAAAANAVAVPGLLSSIQEDIIALTENWGTDRERCFNTFVDHLLLLTVVSQVPLAEVWAEKDRKKTNYGGFKSPLFFVGVFETSEGLAEFNRIGTADAKNPMCRHITMTMGNREIQTSMYAGNIQEDLSSDPQYDPTVIINMKNAVKELIAKLVPAEKETFYQVFGQDNDGKVMARIQRLVQEQSQKSGLGGRQGITLDLKGLDNLKKPQQKLTLLLELFFWQHPGITPEEIEQIFQGAKIIDTVIRASQLQKYLGVLQVADPVELKQRIEQAVQNQDTEAVNRFYAVLRMADCFLLEDADLARSREALYSYRCQRGLAEGPGIYVDPVTNETALKVYCNVEGTAVTTGKVNFSTIIAPRERAFKIAADELFGQYNSKAITREVLRESITRLINQYVTEQDVVALAQSTQAIQPFFEILNELKTMAGVDRIDLVLSTGANTLLCRKYVESPAFIAAAHEQKLKIQVVDSLTTAIDFNHGNQTLGPIDLQGRRTDLMIDKNLYLPSGILYVGSTPEAGPSLEDKLAQRDCVFINTDAKDAMDRGGIVRWVEAAKGDTESTPGAFKFWEKFEKYGMTPKLAGRIEGFFGAAAYLAYLYFTLWHNAPPALMGWNIVWHIIWPALVVALAFLIGHAVFGVYGDKEMTLKERIASASTYLATGTASWTTLLIPVIVAVVISMSWTAPIGLGLMAVVAGVVALASGGVHGWRNEKIETSKRKGTGISSRSSFTAKYGRYLHLTGFILFTAFTNAWMLSIGTVVFLLAIKEPILLAIVLVFFVMAMALDRIWPKVEIAYLEKRKNDIDTNTALEKAKAIFHLFVPETGESICKNDPLLVAALREVKGIEITDSVARVTNGGKNYGNKTILLTPSMANNEELVRYLIVRRALGFYFDSKVDAIAGEFKKTNKVQEEVEHSLSRVEKYPFWIFWSNYETAIRAFRYGYLKNIGYIIAVAFVRSIKLTYNLLFDFYRKSMPPMLISLNAENVARPGTIGGFRRMVSIWKNFVDIFILQKTSVEMTGVNQRQVHADRSNRLRIPARTQDANLVLPDNGQAVCQQIKKIFLSQGLQGVEQFFGREGRGAENHDAGVGSQRETVEVGKISVQSQDNSFFIAAKGDDLVIVGSGQACLFRRQDIMPQLLEKFHAAGKETVVSKESHLDRGLQGDFLIFEDDRGVMQAGFNVFQGEVRVALRDDVLWAQALFQQFENHENRYAGSANAGLAETHSRIQDNSFSGHGQTSFLQPTDLNYHGMDRASRQEVGNRASMLDNSIAWLRTHWFGILMSITFIMFAFAAVDYFYLYRAVPGIETSWGTIIVDEINHFVHGLVLSGTEAFRLTEMLKKSIYLIDSRNVFWIYERFYLFFSSVVLLPIAIDVFHTKINKVKYKPGFLTLLALRNYYLMLPLLFSVVMIFFRGGHTDNTERVYLSPEKTEMPFRIIQSHEMGHVLAGVNAEKYGISKRTLKYLGQYYGILRNEELGRPEPSLISKSDEVARNIIANYPVEEQENQIRKYARAHPPLDSAEVIRSMAESSYDYIYGEVLVKAVLINVGNDFSKARQVGDLLSSGSNYTEALDITGVKYKTPGAFKFWEKFEKYGMTPKLAGRIEGFFGAAAYLAYLYFTLWHNAPPVPLALLNIVLHITIPAIVIALAFLIGHAVFGVYGDKEMKFKERLASASTYLATWTASWTTLLIPVIVAVIISMSWTAPIGLGLAVFGIIVISEASGWVHGARNAREFTNNKIDSAWKAWQAKRTPVKAIPTQWGPTLGANPPAAASFMIADLKFTNQGEVKVLELGPGLGSGFEGYDALHSKSMRTIFWEHLAAMGLPIWYININEKTRPSVPQITMGSGSEFRTAVLQGTWGRKNDTFNPSVIGTYSGIVVLNDADSYRTNSELRKLLKDHPWILPLDGGGAASEYACDKFLTMLSLSGPLKKFAPGWRVFPKTYYKGFAREIIRDLPAKHYVIKPLDQGDGLLTILSGVSHGATHGNGVLVVTAEQLDTTLKTIFGRDQNEEIARMQKMEKRVPDPAHPEEHWLLDQSPVFLIQTFEAGQTASVAGKSYDPTTRMAFILRSDQGRTSVEVLDGYQKLPSQSLAESNGRDAHVSKIRDEGRSSAEIDPKQKELISRQLEAFLPAAYQNMLAMDSATAIDNLLFSDRIETILYGLFLLIRATDNCSLYRLERLLFLATLHDPFIDKALLENIDNIYSHSHEENSFSIAGQLLKHLADSNVPAIRDRVLELCLRYKVEDNLVLLKDRLNQIVNSEVRTMYAFYLFDKSLLDEQTLMAALQVVFQEGNARAQIIALKELVGHELIFRGDCSWIWNYLPENEGNVLLAYWLQMLVSQREALERLQGRSASPHQIEKYERYLADMSALQMARLLKTICAEQDMDLLAWYWNFGQTRRDPVLRTLLSNPADFQTFWNILVKKNSVLETVEAKIDHFIAARSQRPEKVDNEGGLSELLRAMTFKILARLGANINSNPSYWNTWYDRWAFAIETLWVAILGGALLLTMLAGGYAGVALVYGHAGVNVLSAVLTSHVQILVRVYIGIAISLLPFLHLDPNTSRTNRVWAFVISLLCVPMFFLPNTLVWNLIIVAAFVVLHFVVNRWLAPVTTRMQAAKAEKIKNQERKELKVSEWILVNGFSLAAGSLLALMAMAAAGLNPAETMKAAYVLAWPIFFVAYLVKNRGNGTPWLNVFVAGSIAVVNLSLLLAPFTLPVIIALSFLTPFVFGAVAIFTRGYRVVAAYGASGLAAVIILLGNLWMIHHKAVYYQVDPKYNIYRYKERAADLKSIVEPGLTWQKEFDKITRMLKEREMTAQKRQEILGNLYFLQKSMIDKWEGTQGSFDDIMLLLNFFADFHIDPQTTYQEQLMVFRTKRLTVTLIEQAIRAVASFTPVQQKQIVDKIISVFNYRPEQLQTHELQIAPGITVKSNLSFRLNWDIYQAARRIILGDDQTNQEVTLADRLEKAGVNPAPFAGDYYSGTIYQIIRPYETVEDYLEVEGSIHTENTAPVHTIPLDFVDVVRALREMPPGLLAAIKDSAKEYNLDFDLLAMGLLSPYNLNYNLKAAMKHYAHRNPRSMMGQSVEWLSEYIPENLSLGGYLNDYLGTVVFNGKASIGVYQIRTGAVREFKPWKRFGITDFQSLTDRDIALLLLDPKYNVDAYAAMMRGCINETEAIRDKMKTKTGQIPFLDKFRNVSEHALYVGADKIDLGAASAYRNLPSQSTLGNQEWLLLNFHPLYHQKLWPDINYRWIVAASGLRDQKPGVFIVRTKQDVATVRMLTHDRNLSIRQAAQATLNQLQTDASPLLTPEGNPGAFKFWETIGVPVKWAGRIEGFLGAAAYLAYLYFTLWHNAPPVPMEWMNIVGHIVMPAIVIALAFLIGHAVFGVYGKEPKNLRERMANALSSTWTASWTTLLIPVIVAIVISMSWTAPIGLGLMAVVAGVIAVASGGVHGERNAGWNKLIKVPVSENVEVFGLPYLLISVGVLIAIAFASLMLVGAGLIIVGFVCMGFLIEWMVEAKHQQVFDVKLNAWRISTPKERWYLKAQFWVVGLSGIAVLGFVSFGALSNVTIFGQDLLARASSRAFSSGYATGMIAGILVHSLLFNLLKPAIFKLVNTIFGTHYSPILLMSSDEKTTSMPATDPYFHAEKENNITTLEKILGLGRADVERAYDQMIEAVARHIERVDVFPEGVDELDIAYCEPRQLSRTEGAAILRVYRDHTLTIESSKGKRKFAWSQIGRKIKVDDGHIKKDIDALISVFAPVKPGWSFKQILETIEFGFFVRRTQQGEMLAVPSGRIAQFDASEIRLRSSILSTLPDFITELKFGYHFHPAGSTSVDSGALSTSDKRTLIERAKVTGHPALEIIWTDVKDHPFSELSYSLVRHTPLAVVLPNRNIRMLGHVYSVKAGPVDQYSTIDLIRDFLQMTPDEISERSKIDAIAKQFMEPIRNLQFNDSRVPHLNYMIKHDYPTMAEFWHELELEAEYRERFSSDNEFWNSGSSLYGIYHELKNLQVAKQTSKSEVDKPKTGGLSELLRAMTFKVLGRFGANITGNLSYWHVWYDRWAFVLEAVWVAALGGALLFTMLAGGYAGVALVYGHAGVNVLSAVLTSHVQLLLRVYIGIAIGLLPFLHLDSQTSRANRVWALVISLLCVPLFFLPNTLVWNLTIVAAFVVLHFMVNRWLSPLSRWLHGWVNESFEPKLSIEATMLDEVISCCRPSSKKLTETAGIVSGEAVPARFGGKPKIFINRFVNSNVLRSSFGQVTLLYDSREEQYESTIHFHSHVLTDIIGKKTEPTQPSSEDLESVSRFKSKTGIVVVISPKGACLLYGYRPKKNGTWEYVPFKVVDQGRELSKSEIAERWGQSMLLGLNPKAMISASAVLTPGAFKFWEKLGVSAKWAGRIEGFLGAAAYLAYLYFTLWHNAPPVPMDWMNIVEHIAMPAIVIALAFLIGHAVFGVYGKEPVDWRERLANALSATRTASWTTLLIPVIVAIVISMSWTAPIGLGLILVVAGVVAVASGWLHGWRNYRYYFNLIAENKRLKLNEYSRASFKDFVQAMLDYNAGKGAVLWDLKSDQRLQQEHMDALWVKQFHPLNAAPDLKQQEQKALEQQHFLGWTCKSGRKYYIAPAITPMFPGQLTVCAKAEDGTKQKLSLEISEDILELQELLISAGYMVEFMDIGAMPVDWDEFHFQAFPKKPGRKQRFAIPLVRQLEKGNIHYTEIRTAANGVKLRAFDKEGYQQSGLSGENAYPATALVLEADTLEDLRQTRDQLGQALDRHDVKIDQLTFRAASGRYLQIIFLRSKQEVNIGGIKPGLTEMAGYFNCADQTNYSQLQPNHAVSNLPLASASRDELYALLDEVAPFSVGPRTGVSAAGLSLDLDLAGMSATRSDDGIFKSSALLRLLNQSMHSYFRMDKDNIVFQSIGQRAALGHLEKLHYHLMIGENISLPVFFINLFLGRYLRLNTTPTLFLPRQLLVDYVQGSGIRHWLAGRLISLAIRTSGQQRFQPGLLRRLAREVSQLTRQLSQGRSQGLTITQSLKLWFSQHDNPVIQQRRPRFRRSLEGSA